jgi:tetratricopeptide (TPR) repeat protein
MKENKERSMEAVFLCLYFILVTLLPLSGSEKALLTTEEWLEDLDFVVTTLKSQHPNIYYKINITNFDAVVAESRSQIARSKSDLECYFSIKRIIAVIEDGHTGLLEDGIFNLLDLRFPFRVDEFTDGVYITLIRKENEVFLGSRVTAVNGQPIENVLATIEKVVSSDNRFGRRYWALNGISFARVLYGLKIIDNTNEIELSLILQNGSAAKLALPSMRDDSPIEYNWSTRLNIGPTKGEYISPSDKLSEKMPLFLKNQGEKINYYWFEHLVNDRTIYFQFNQVMNQPDKDETFAQFSARMWNYIDQNAGNIDKLVIDLRQNNGGNGVLILPFLNQIIKRDHINRDGGLFVISGKRTYSAASIFMNELAVHTNVRFIGEPDGCGSDLFSDNRLAGRLPHSRFPLWIARFHFTSRWPGNNTEYFMPHFPAPFSSRDYFNGHDPALEMALIGGLRSVSEYAADKGTDAAITYIRQLKETYKDLDWWTALNPENLERDINREGYELIANGDLKRALRVFTLNTLLFPKSSNAWDSMGECAYNMKEFDLSLQYYKKSIELNPDNISGKQMIERIMREKKKLLARGIEPPTC